MQRLKLKKKSILATLLGALFLLLPLMAEASDNPAYLLYVARFMDNDIVIIDSKTGKITGKIDLGYSANPSDMLLSPDKKTLYVTNRGTDELAVIDISTNKIIRKVKTGIHPHFIKFTPDNKYLIVVNNQDTRATILNARTLELVGAPRIDDGASGIAVSRDNRFAYIPSIYLDNISIINLKTMRRIATIKSSVPMAIIRPPESDLAYFCSHRDRISVLDMRTNKIVKEIPAGDTPNHTTLSKDNRLLFVTNALSDTLSVIDIKKQINIKEIKVGDEPLSSTLSPNGKLLYVVNYGGRHEKSSISVIDTTELKEIKRIKIDRYPRAVAVVEADI